MLSAQVLSHKLALRRFDMKGQSCIISSVEKFSSVENLGSNCPLNWVLFMGIAAIRDFIVLRPYDALDD
jgi:hypothetical protein